MNTFISLYLEQNKTFPEIEDIYLKKVKQNLCNDNHTKINEEYIYFRKWYDFLGCECFKEEFKNRKDFEN